MTNSVEYNGGYYLLDEPIVRGWGTNSHTARDLTQLGKYAVQALNIIQNTEWEINPFVLSVVNQLKALGGNLTYTKRGNTETVLRLVQPINPRNDPFEPALKQHPKEVWDAMSKEEKKENSERRAKCFATYEEHLGVYRATKRILALANEMEEHERFYFPHNMDFRTRIYPIPNDLTPQSNDLSKGLLRFHRGTRLGEEGYYWQAVMVASHWGEDKLGMNERRDFAHSPEFYSKLEKWVDDPVTNRGWVEADAPFQLLAMAHEFVWATRSGDPYSFVSKLPGNLDGSCNGAQHLSIMSRDVVGATATNCRSYSKTNGQRHDLYMRVAEVVWEDVQVDALGGNPLAIEWAPKLQTPSDRRKVVKRSVMTVPYGVTEFGIAEFMIADKHTDGADNKWNSARYIRDIIWRAIQRVLNRGQELQVWFQTCATIVAEAGLPLCWDTPAGTKVTQAYRNLVERRITAFGTKFTVYSEPLEDESKDDFLNRVGMNVKKMGTSAPPNVVHSCDASHLQITTCRMAQAGIRDFSMVHDSFGCPLAHVSLMRDILRKTAVDMYQGNYLQQWKESVEKYSGLTLPDHPPLGDFDIHEILESEFFFS